eukprot:m.4534 g.4534  ORF g.4534 m.4534 type:complete len:365 (+) comp2246_c0_seq1:238-1332(+)
MAFRLVVLPVLLLLVLFQNQQRQNVFATAQSSNLPYTVIVRFDGLPVGAHFTFVQENSLLAIFLSVAGLSGMEEANTVSSSILSDKVIIQYTTASSMNASFLEGISFPTKVTLMGGSTATITLTSYSAERFGSPTTAPTSNSANKTGTIVGIVVAGILLLIIAIVVFIVVMRRKRKKKATIQGYMGGSTTKRNRKKNKKDDDEDDGSEDSDDEDVQFGGNAKWNEEVTKLGKNSSEPETPQHAVAKSSQSTKVISALNPPSNNKDKLGVRRKGSAKAAVRKPTGRNHGNPYGKDPVTFFIDDGSFNSLARQMDSTSSTSLQKRNPSSKSSTLTSPQHSRHGAETSSYLMIAESHTSADVDTEEI